MKLYRAMKADRLLNKPKIGDTARELGIRITGELLDIKLINNYILPDDGGMSVSPNSPSNLPEHRRKKDPVWEIDSVYLKQFGVRYCEDKLNKHGLIKPIDEMTLPEYQQAIAKTQNYWQLVENGL